MQQLPIIRPPTSSTPSTRGRIIALREAGVSCRAIAYRCGVHETTFRRTILRVRATGNVYNRSRSQGRPDRDFRHMISEVREELSQPWSFFAERWGVSVSTTRRTAHLQNPDKYVRRRKPFLSLNNKLARVQRARDVQNLDWKRVIFTDECSIELNGRPARSWTIRAPGEEYLPAHIDTPFKSERRTIMIWGAIAYDNKFPLLRLPLLPARQVNGVRPVPETLNAAKYAEWVLEERIAPYGGDEGRL